MMKTRSQGSGARSQGPGVRGLCVLTTGYWLLTTVLFAAPLRWTCSWPDAGAQSFALYRGETATFEPRLKINGVVATNAEIAAVWYTTNTMSSVASGEGGWWRLDNATFAPSNDVGALSYRFFVEFRDQGSGVSSQESVLTTETIYRANGTLRMLPSPGVTPNALPLPAKTIDFAEVEVENAPWPAEIEAAIAEIQPPDLSDYATHAEVETAISGITETDPVWEAEKADYLSQSEWQESWEPILRDVDNRSWANESAIGSITSDIESITNEFTYTAISNTVTKEFVEDLGIKPEYTRTFGTSTRNRTVQYVNVTNTAPSTLALQIPVDGEVKDWLVYVVSVTNVTLSLPPATYWMSDVAHTNDIAPATPTALYFTEATNGVFVVGRQELKVLEVAE